LARVKRSWKSERELWLKFQLNWSIFLFSPLKYLKYRYRHSKFWLFKPIFRHLDPESGSGFQIRTWIPDPDPYWMRIHPDTEPKHTHPLSPPAIRKYLPTLHPFCLYIFHPFAFLLPFSSFLNFPPLVLTLFIFFPIFYVIRYISVCERGRF
jgi:hypothetical protein